MDYLIKEIRIKKGLTQKQVYSDICPYRHYIRVENNNGDASVELLVKLSIRLGVNVEELINIPESFYKYRVYN